MSVRQAFISVLFGNTAAAGILFIINVLLAHTLTLESFGRINLIFTLSMLLFAVADFGTSNTIVIFYNRFKDGLDASNYSYIYRCYLFYLVLCLVGGVVAGILFQHIYDLSIIELVTILLSFSCFLIYRHFNAVNQAIGNWRDFNYFNVLNNLIKLISIFASLFILGKAFRWMTGYNSILVGMLFHSVLILTIAMLFNAFRRGKVAITGSNKRIEKKIVGILIPLGVMNIFIVVTMRFGSLIVEKVLGSEYLAIYSAANILAMVIPLITTSLMNVMIKDASEKGLSCIPKILSIQKKYFKYLILIFIIGSLLSRCFISLIFGEDFIEAAGVFTVLMVPYLGGVYFTPLESYFYGYDQKMIMVLRFFQMVIVVVGSIVMIMPFKLYGVALAIAISRIFGWFFITKKAKSLSRGISYA